MEIAQTIRDTISQGDIVNAINLLLINSKGKFPHIQSEATLLSARFNDLSKDIRNNIISFENGQLAKSLIIKSVLDLLNEFDKTINEGAKQKHYKKIILIAESHPYEIQCFFDNSVSLGRSSTCDISFFRASKNISNWHCRIAYITSKNEYVIQDLNSTNGTYVNGNAVKVNTLLNFGSKIRLSSNLFLLFKKDNDSKNSSGVLLYFDSSGEELARYIIAPNGLVNIGTNLNDTIRHPLFPIGTSYGFIKNENSKLYFISENSNGEVSKENLYDQMQLKLSSLTFKVTVF